MGKKETNALKRLDDFSKSLVQMEPVVKGNEYLLAISGLSPVSNDALFGRDLIIRHFPFSIGRGLSINNFSSTKPDFVLSDKKPYRISRQHLTITRRNEHIVLTDTTSRLGSLVNGILIGKKAGGKSNIALSYGENEVILGGHSSPFIHTANTHLNRHPGSSCTK